MPIMPPFQDISIRDAVEADAEGIARVKIATWRTAYAGIVPDSLLDGFDIHEQMEHIREKWFPHGPNPAFAFIAAHSGTAVGFAISGPQRDAAVPFDAELYAIYVLPDFQHQGIGRGLVLAVLDRLLALRCASLSVWVFAENPARRFYEKLGGQALGLTKQVEIAGKSLTEISYGWKDIASLRRVLAPAE